MQKKPKSEERCHKVHYLISYNFLSMERKTTSCFLYNISYYGIWGSEFEIALLIQRYIANYIFLLHKHYQYTKRTSWTKRYIVNVEQNKFSVRLELHHMFHLIILQQFYFVSSEGLLNFFQCFPFGFWNPKPHKNHCKN